MRKQQYDKWTNRIRQTRYGARIIGVSSKCIAALTICVYPLYLIYLFIADREFLYPAILVPTVAFLTVSIYRRYNHSKRPYEELDIEPLIHKETVGKSFPSRHVFSIFMIAVTVMHTSILGGCLLIGTGTLLGIMRVVGGVHYPKDVIAGAVLGILSGLIGYVVIF